MASYIEDIDDGFVEAIERGKIVTVEAEYAEREGLPILKSLPSANRIEERTWSGKEKNERGIVFDSDNLMDMLSHKKQTQIEKALIPHFNWKIVQARRTKGFTRNEFGVRVGLSMKQIKMLENGIFPTQDLTTLARIEEFLSINLRKEIEEFEQPMRRIVDRNALKEESKFKHLNLTADSGIKKDSEWREIRNSRNKRKANEKINFERIEKKAVDEKRATDNSLESEEDIFGEGIELID